MPRVSVVLDAFAARQALVYGRHLAGDSSPHTEYLFDHDVPLRAGDNIIMNTMMLSFPHRETAQHHVVFDGEPLILSVDDKTSGNNETLVLSVQGASYNTIDAFFVAAKEHCESLIAVPLERDSIRRFIFDSGYWDRLGEARKRPSEFVFLEKDARELVDYVVSFMTDPAVKERHISFGIPFKLNVLLHGKPGTGKTTLIETVAGRLGSDVFIVNFNGKLRDADLAVAMRKVSEHRHPIVVMEDVDSLFLDHKPHDTARNSITLGGLVNALDGMSRPEGSVVFMTTNHADCLAPAVTRSRRIDKQLRLSHASSQQTHDMISAYFPGLSEVIISKFSEGTACTEYTMAELSEYIFSCRSGDEIDAAAFVRSCRSRAPSRPDNPMYM